MFKKSLIIVLLYLLQYSNTFADSGNTILSIDVGRDEQDNKNSMLSADVELKNTKHLFWGLGKSKIPSGTTVIESNQSYIGLSKKYDDDLKVTGMLESTGLRNAFNMLSVSSLIRYNSKDYFAELVPALRTITLTTLSNNKITLSSSVIGIKIGGFMGQHFRLSGSAYLYNYSRDVSRLASFASTRYFNVKTLLLSSGLLKKSNNLEAGLDFKRISVSIGKNSSTSAIDYKKSDYIYTVADVILSKAFSLSILYGKFLDTPEDQNNYSSLTLNYAF